MKWCLMFAVAIKAVSLPAKVFRERLSLTAEPFLQAFIPLISFRSFMPLCAVTNNFKN